MYVIEWVSQFDFVTRPPTREELAADITTYPDKALAISAAINELESLKSKVRDALIRARKKQYRNDRRPAR